MTEYAYKGFQVRYDIKPSERSPGLYRADGLVLCSINNKDNTPQLSEEFHTEFVSEEGAQHEIKRLIENYIDYEWSQFYAMQDRD